MSTTISIVGGGMVGASLALALQDCARKANWKIRLIEAYPPNREGVQQPSYDARSTALSQGSRKLYERLGIWSTLSQRVEPIKQIDVSDRGHPGSARINAAQERVPALGYVIENAWLGEVLIGALDHDVVEWIAPGRVTRAIPRADGYDIEVDSPTGEQNLHTDLLVIADGGRSSLLAQLGVHRDVSPYGQVALIANITSAEGHAQVAYERFTDSGPLALLPMSGNRSALVWTLPDDQSAEVASLPDAAFLQRLQSAFGYHMGALLKVGERNCYPLSLIKAEEQVRSHLVILGNAAHSLHPIAGQGFNLSLRDTLALADTLIQAQQEHKSPGELGVLMRYLERQRRDQLMTVAFSDRLTRLFSNRQPLLAAGRNLGLLGLDILPPAKRLFARQAMGL